MLIFFFFFVCNERWINKRNDKTRSLVVDNMENKPYIMTERSNKKPSHFQRKMPNLLNTSKKKINQFDQVKRSINNKLIELTVYHSNQFFEMIVQTNEVLPPSSCIHNIIIQWQNTIVWELFLVWVFVCNCFASLYGFAVCSIRLMGFRWIKFFWLS